MVGLLLLAANARAAAGAAASDPRIEHFVVLYMENRPFDQFFGCMDLPGADSAATMTRNRTLVKDPKNLSAGTVNVTCGSAEYVCGKKGGMHYNLWAGQFGDSNDSHYPYGPQNDDHSYANGAYDESIQMFSPAQLPVKSAIAQEFGVFNKMFSSVPSASTPNHLFTQSATSCGVADNIMWNQCDGPNYTYPQMTIYDGLQLVNKSFGFYVNTTVPAGCDSYPKACDHGGWSELGDANYPDVMMDGIARHQDRFFDYADLFAQAANGTLPNFVWIAPNNSYSDHPCNDVAKGERLTKDIYEAIRAGPGWSKTLMAVIYDDAGAVYDHVTPPYAPTDDAPCNVGNRPGPGPPPSPEWHYSKPLNSGKPRHPLYQRGARLLTEVERAKGMSGRAPRAEEGVHGRWNSSWVAPMANDSNLTTLHNAATSGGADARSDPPELDGQMWTMLSTYDRMNKFVGFTYNGAPPGFKGGQEWMRVEYTAAKDAMPVEFHEIKSERGPAGRVYKLRNHWPATKPTYTGWVTFETDPTNPKVQWFHANGTEETAVHVRVEGTSTAGEIVLLNLGTDAAPLPATSTGYISFADDGLWVRCNGYGLKAAMTVKLMRPGTPAPPAPPAPPPAPTPCSKKFDFRRLGMRTAAMLMSPYIPKGTVFQEPKGPYPDSQFDLSSMSTTIKELFGIPGFMTQRDAWAGSFHELLTLDRPRTDTPLHLPDAPPPLAVRERRRLARQAKEQVAGSPPDTPLHCSPTAAPETACAADGNAVTTKQRNQMRVFSALVGTPPPTEEEVAAMDKEAAALYIHKRWAAHVNHGVEWFRNNKPGLS